MYNNSSLIFWQLHTTVWLLAKIFSHSPV